MALLQFSATRAAEEPAEPRAAGLATVAALARDYRPIARLDSDEWGPAFLAEQIRVGRRRVRIRLFPLVGQAHPERLVRFQEDMAAAARLAHRHVAAIYESGETADGTVYVVLESPGGESVAARLRRSGPLPLAEAVEVVAQCAGALDAGRQLGIRPRRLSLDSIVLTQDPESGLTVKLNDFGLPRPTDLGVDGGTSNGPLPSRAAVEPGARTDIRSLALVTRVMLTGDPVFASPRPDQGGAGPEPRPGTERERPALPDAIEAVLARALEPDGESSYRTAADLAVALRQAASADAEPAPALSGAPPAPSAPVPPWRARQPNPPSSPPEPRARSPRPLFATPETEDHDRSASPRPDSHTGEPTPGTPPPPKDETRRSPRRRLLGELLVTEGRISPIQLEQALRLQAERGPETPLGQILLEQEAITRLQLREVLNRYHKKYRLGDLLVETNTITEEQLRVALDEQAATGLRLGEVLFKLGYVSDQALREALCKQLSISFLALDAAAIDRRLADLIPKDYARERRVVPIARSDGRLTVAMDDPTDVDVVDELRRQTACDIEVVTSTYAAFWQAFFRLYESGHDGPGDALAEPAAPTGGRPAGPAEGDDAPVPDPSSPDVHAPERPVAGEASRERDPLPDRRLAEVEARYAALLREHELAVDALREQRELCQRLLQEKQEVAACLERVIGRPRTPPTL
jgi:serine/threonine protein kinase